MCTLCMYIMCVHTCARVTHVYARKPDRVCFVSSRKYPGPEWRIAFRSGLPGFPDLPPAGTFPSSFSVAAIWAGLTSSDPTWV